jgi:hypothetical protein
MGMEFKPLRPHQPNRRKEESMNKEMIRLLLRLTIESFLSQYSDPTPLMYAEDVYNTFELFLTEHGYEMVEIGG